MESVHHFNTTAALFGISNAQTQEYVFTLFHFPFYYCLPKYFLFSVEDDDDDDGDGDDDDDDDDVMRINTV